MNVSKSKTIEYKGVKAVLETSIVNSFSAPKYVKASIIVGENEFTERTKEFPDYDTLLSTLSSHVGVVVDKFHSWVDNNCKDLDSGVEDILSNY